MKSFIPWFFFPQSIFMNKASMFWMCLSSCYLHMLLTLMILIYKKKDILGVIISRCRYNNLLFLPFEQAFHTVVRKRPISITESNTFFLDAYDFIRNPNNHRSNYIFEFSFRQLHPKYINKKAKKWKDRKLITYEGYLPMHRSISCYPIKKSSSFLKSI